MADMPTIKVWGVTSFSGAAATALATLDTNRNGTVEPVDFLLPKGVSDATRDRVMTEAVTAALRESNYLTDEVQLRGLVDFPKIYQAVQRFDELTTEWSGAGATLNTFARGTEREFPATFWNASVLPHITGDGAVTPENLSVLSQRIYFLVRRLEGLEPENLKLGHGESCDEEFVTGMLYNPALLPENMRAPVADLVDRYVRSATWFFQAQQMECEGEGCPEQDEVRYFYTDRIPSIQANPLSLTVVDYVYCKL